MFDNLKTFFELRGYTIKAVGVFAPSFNRYGKTYDEVFYDQVKIDFSKRWDSFDYPRDKEKEMKLFTECFSGLTKGDYIFLHDDPDRGRVINRKDFPKGVKVITPHQRFWEADILDYRYVLENALEIHCVNSSFADLMDSFDLSKVKKLKIATLFFKPDVFRKSLPIDYIGRSIDDKFIVGYGLDYDGLGRNLSDIYQLKQN